MSSKGVGNRFFADMEEVSFEEQELNTEQYIGVNEVCRNNNFFGGTWRDIPCADSGARDI